MRLTGDVPLSDEEFASLEENIGLVAMVMLGRMLLILWLATRSVRQVGAILATIVLGLITTLAIGLLAVGSLNLISIAFIPLFVGLGVDFGIQICVRFGAERAEERRRRKPCAAPPQCLPRRYRWRRPRSSSASARSCPPPMSGSPNWA